MGVGGDPSTALQSAQGSFLSLRTGSGGEEAGIVEYAFLLGRPNEDESLKGEMLG